MRYIISNLKQSLRSVPKMSKFYLNRSSTCICMLYSKVRTYHLAVPHVFVLFSSSFFFPYICFAACTYDPMDAFRCNGFKKLEVQLSSLVLAVLSDDTNLSKWRKFQLLLYNSQFLTSCTSEMLFSFTRQLQYYSSHYLCAYLHGATVNRQFDDTADEKNLGQR